MSTIKIGGRKLDWGVQEMDDGGGYDIQLSPVLTYEVPGVYHGAGSGVT